LSLQVDGTYDCQKAKYKVHRVKKTQLVEVKHVTHFLLVLSTLWLRQRMLKENAMND
jgi:hypothetical protein